MDARRRSSLEGGVERCGREVGAKCSRFERCFVTKLRRAAEQAKIVIVNHHLFFADLAVPEEAGSRVLPPGTRWCSTRRTISRTPRRRSSG